MSELNKQKVILTLQYCLETFEQTCQCGTCDPCTTGQQDIREAISWLKETSSVLEVSQ